jgi:DNA-binding CsgD family transcriptional regulator
MPGSLEEKAVRLLEGIVDAETLHLYLRLLGGDGWPLADATNLLGGEEALEALIGAGMAETGEHAQRQQGLVTPVPADLVLQRELAALSRDVLIDHERVLDGYQRMYELSASLDEADDASVTQLVQIITDTEEVERITRTLLGSVQRDWLTMNNRIPASGETVSEPVAPALSSPADRGTRCRTIYESSCLEDAATHEKLMSIAESGVHVRTHPQVRLNMCLGDEAIALIPLTSATCGSAIFIQSSVIVGALWQYFELLWERGIPFGAGGSARDEIPKIQTRILRLLVQGLPDEAVAERVDLSLTTVRRHIKAIREELGAETRFELGAIAVQQGLVD